MSKMDEFKNKVPFHCLICGPTNCGKTKFIIDKLHSSFRYVFEYIVLICPTYPHNKTYCGFGNFDPRFIVLSPDSDESEEIDNLLSCCQTFFSGSNTLIILDDCAVSKDLKKRSNKFINLAFSGRHEGISIWVLTQQLTSISKPFRDNVACVIAFHNPSHIGMKTLFDDYGSSINSDEQKKITKILKTKRFSKLCICLRYPYSCFCEIPSPKQLIEN